MMHHGIEHLLRTAKINLRDAITMATRNPARVGRVAQRQRGLANGERADLVRFRFDQHERQIDIVETYVSGECVYRAA